MKLRYLSETETGAVPYRDRIRVSTSNCAWQAWTHFTTYTGPVLSSLAYGIDTPHYRKRLRDKEIIPMTAYERYDAQGALKPEYRSFSRTGTLCNPYIEIESNAAFPTVLGIDGLRALAPDSDLSYYVQAAAAKIYGSGWDGLTFIAELHKTKKMLVGFATRLVRNMLSGRWDHIWLEARYGWRVLWYDMQDIAKVIQNLDGERKRFRESVGTTEKSVYSGSTPTGSQYGTAHWTTYEEITLGIRGTVVADIEPPKVSFNPFVTGWELITFSFVIDWILNVGQWLESMSFLALSTSYTSAGGLMVKRRAEKGPLFYTAYTSPFNGSSIVDPQGPSWVEETLLCRVPLGIPKSPLTQLRIDSLKVVDLLALLFSRLKR